MNMVLENVTESIKDYKEIIYAKDKHIENISKIKIKGCRGQLASNLISFAMSGTWSVISQNYVVEKIQYKIPIVCIKSILMMMIQTRDKVQTLLSLQAEIDSNIINIISAFQIFMVHEQEEYMDNNPHKYDYMRLWSKASSWTELTKNPLKNHSKWVFFFCTKKKTNINNLMIDIKTVCENYDNIEKLLKLSYHEESLKTESKVSTLKRKLPELNFNEIVEIYKKK